MQPLFLGAADGRNPGKPIAFAVYDIDYSVSRGIG